MTAYLVRRLLQAALVLLIVSAATFALIQAAPGGPAVMVSADLSPADREIIKQNLGLDRPLHVQYWRWLTAIARGDFGKSFVESRAVGELVAERMPATLLLSGAALLVAVLLGVPLGIAAARRPNSTLDYVLSGCSVFGLSVPAFWLGIMLILLFSVRWRLLPSAGMLTLGRPFSFGDLAAHLVMPVTVLALVYVAEITGYARSSLLQVLRRDYVRTARAKGLSERVVLYKHALRNGLIPVVTVFGAMIPRLVGGAAVTETLFAWPGMGRLAVDAAFKRDYPLVMGITIVFALVVVASNLMVDVAYGVLDPRVRFGREARE